jgi:hypothetical protein
MWRGISPRAVSARAPCLWYPCPLINSTLSTAAQRAEHVTCPPALPQHPPSHLPSPLSVLGWQAGDSFDMAVVLASLLLGAGYNAFVVVGYAPLAVTMNDQSATECPVLEVGSKGLLADPLLTK